MEKKNYIPLQKLEVYILARELSKQGWHMYEGFSWQDKKVIGDQFITSTDSVGANVAEGYARYHYLDKIKFYYTARGSLSEAADHWVPLLLERKKITQEACVEYQKKAKLLEIKLNNFISSHYAARDRK